MADYLAALLDRSRQRRAMPPPAVCRSLREEAGVTQTELARALGVARETESRWEAGKRRPQGLKLVAYLDALDRIAEAVGARDRGGPTWPTCRPH